MLTLNSDDTVMQATNPRTGHQEPAHWMPNHFGPGKAGVRFQDGDVRTVREVQEAGRRHRRKLCRHTSQS